VVEVGRDLFALDGEGRALLTRYEAALRGMNACPSRKIDYISMTSAFHIISQHF
jgi:hypothetical protein